MTDKVKKKFIRQGDVFLMSVDSIPTGIAKVPAVKGRVILAYGETTGHHHSLALSRRITLFRDDGSGGTMYLDVGGKTPATLEHQEHTALKVPVGQYKVTIQRTYSGKDKVAKRVVD